MRVGWFNLYCFLFEIYIRYLVVKSDCVVLLVLLVIEDVKLEVKGWVDMME